MTLREPMMKASSAEEGKRQLLAPRGSSEASATCPGSHFSGGLRVSAGVFVQAFGAGVASNLRPKLPQETF